MATHRGPVGVEAIGDFNALIDARSPSEYALDHIPGAVNHPVLNDEERAQVGTIYKQKSAFEARRIGAGLASISTRSALARRCFTSSSGTLMLPMRALSLSV